MARSRQRAGTTPTLDTLLGIVASSEDPIAQGRHKVWGSRPLWIPPQTSTIASHLPKAMGLAFSLARAKRIGVGIDLPEDAVVVCSFGDASANHATALAAINTARYAVRMGLPMPLLLVCEDNGTGISVPTPEGWIESTFGGMPHLRYIAADGELDETWTAVETAIAHVRGARQPVFLHLRTVRLWGHAGSDAEPTYRSIPQIEEVEARDPLVRNARRLVELGAATPDELRDLVRETRDRVMAVAEEAARRPQLQTTEEVVAPMAPYHADRVRERAASARGDARRAVGRRSAARCRRRPEPRTPARWRGRSTPPWPTSSSGGRSCSSSARTSGERAASTTSRTGCSGDSAPARVFDTLLDETSILGIAQGAAHIGLLPVPEIQYLAYVHNAIDQLRGEAATLQFFSSGQFRNPMVVRVPGLAYQKGFGGHFHNDNSVGALRDIPGLVLAAPARGDDAARMLRGAIAMAAEDGRVVVFLEPIALYHEKDLHADGDEGWLTTYPAPPEVLLPGEVGLYGETDARRSAPDQLRQRPSAQPPGGETPRGRARPAGSRHRPPMAQPAADGGDSGAGRRHRHGGRRRRVPRDRRRRRRRDHRGPRREQDREASRLGPGGRLVRAARSRDRGRARRRRPGRRGRGCRRRQAQARGVAIVMRAAVAFPGRGSYGPPSLGSLPAGHPWVRRADELRAAAGLQPLAEIDGAERFDPSVHLRPSNAWPLVFLCSLLDAERIADDHEVVVVRRQLDGLVHGARRLGRPRIR